jgi:nucleoid-associated protein YgaU
LLGVLIGGIVGILAASDGKAPVAVPAAAATPAPSATPPAPAAPAADPRVPVLTAEVRELEAKLRSKRERPRSHVMRREETLSELAEHYYGDPEMGWLIAGVNGLNDLDAVPAGIELVIPPGKLAQRGET